MCVCVCVCVLVGFVVVVGGGGGGWFFFGVCFGFPPISFGERPAFLGETCFEITNPFK